MKSITLTQGKITLVDDEDFERLNQHTWCAVNISGRFYSISNMYNGKNNPIKMHRFILGDACAGMDVDHKDGDSLNNQKSNLRICTRAENVRNRKKPKVNNYRYVGVALISKRWRAVIGHGGKVFHLGMFDTEEQAAHAYDTKAREFFGEFARTNF